MRLDGDGMVRSVRRAQAKIRASSEPELAEALHPALNVAYFLLDGHGPNFEDYLAAFMSTGLPLLGDFSSREAFDVWLKSRPALVARGEMSIAGVRYCLGYSRADGMPLLLRLTRPEDLRRPVVGEGEKRLWLALDKTYDVLQSSLEDREGFEAASLALHFVAEAGYARDFAHFLAHLGEPLPPLLVFATRDEAESWLKQHPRPPHGASVQIGDNVFTVGYQREREQRVLVHFPKVEPLAT